MMNAPEKITVQWFGQDNSIAEVNGPPAPWSSGPRAEYVRADLYQAQYDRAEQNGFNYVMAKEHLHLNELELELHLELQPIETAPRDGTYIVLFGPSGYRTTPLRCEVGFYDTGSWRTHSNDWFTEGGEEPTHWMHGPKEMYE